MPPKCKFTRDDVLAAALQLVQEDGVSALTARGLAGRLGSSPKPIFGLFQSMEEVLAEVMCAAEHLYQQYLNTDMAAGEYPPYKASGMAYIRFAKEQPSLFKLLFMRDRRGEPPRDDRGSIAPILQLIERDLGVDENTALLIHTELWVVVHGIATMIATNYLDWDLAFVSRTLTDVYEGLKYRHTEGYNGCD